MTTAYHTVLRAARQAFNGQVDQQAGEIVGANNVIHIDAKKKVRPHDDLAPFFDKRSWWFVLHRTQDKTIRRVRLTKKKRGFRMKWLR